MGSRCPPRCSGSFFIAAISFGLGVGFFAPVTALGSLHTPTPVTPTGRRLPTGLLRGAGCLRGCRALVTAPTVAVVAKTGFSPSKLGGGP